jgi:hypothetical protein
MGAPGENLAQNRLLLRRFVLGSGSVHPRVDPECGCGLQFVNMWTPEVEHLFQPILQFRRFWCRDDPEAWSNRDLFRNCKANLEVISIVKLLKIDDVNVTDCV